MHSWTQKQIAYMHDAIRFSDYYRVIAARIAPYLVPEGTLCDAGCGLGELGMALLPCCRHVTCIDRDENAIADLCRRKPEGITALCGDVENHCPSEPYDAMVFCLFGSTRQALEIAKVKCRGKVFLIKRNYATHRFSADALPIGDYTAENTARELTGMGIPFSVESFTADLGQPFHSMAAAREFFATYNRSGRPITDAELKCRLQKGPSEEFPLFLPHTKQLQLFTIDAADICLSE